MQRDDPTLVHSVAFRVSEDQWVALKRYAENNGTTIPRLAKEVLFERLGLETRVEGRRIYGQPKRDANHG